MTKETIKQIEKDYWEEKADPIDMAEVFDLAFKALEQPDINTVISKIEDMREKDVLCKYPYSRCIEVIKGVMG